MSSRNHRFFLLVLTAGIAAGLFGCSIGPTSAPAGTGPASPVDSRTVVVENCGLRVVVSAPPKRIVTIKSSATELALALGLRDKIVGSAFADGSLPPDLVNLAPPVMAEQLPSAEELLAARPDFVYAGWQSNLTAKTAGDRGHLQKLGINTYISPAACEGEYRPQQLTFDQVFAEITETGLVLGATDQAEQLVADQRAELAAIGPAGKGKRALWYSSGSDLPYVGGGNGAPQMIMDKLGLVNVGADIDDSWGTMGWEAVAAGRPDVIILVDAAWSTADSKIERLEASPLTRDLPAVRRHHYLRVEFAETQAGWRNVAATGELAEQLTRLPQ
jgi:iron complex transport system substrate-binding protein